MKKNNAADWLYKGVASLGFLGYIPLAPGTIGSLVSVGVLWFAAGRFPAYFGTGFVACQWVALMLMVFVSIRIASRAVAANRTGDADPQSIIVDEFVGQLITFFMVPISLRTVLLGFFLFRFFDIVKPFPVHNMEEIEGGTGIVMDDVVAGVCANVVLLCAVWGYHAVHGLLNV